ncbi:uncharacterized protein LOC142409836 [Mycteria americana]|uniref:uncharacterized protein LOC142409836 n=1 Tax=Mycteria americana TaxID=33587 RepID=UPI003F58ADAB
MGVTSCPRDPGQPGAGCAGAPQPALRPRDTGTQRCRQHEAQAPSCVAGDRKRACAVGRVGNYSPRHALRGSGVLRMRAGLLPGCCGSRAQACLNPSGLGRAPGPGPGPATGSRGVKWGREPAARCGRSGGTGRALGRRQGGPPPPWCTPRSSAAATSWCRSHTPRRERGSSSRTRPGQRPGWAAARGRGRAPGQQREPGPGRGRNRDRGLPDFSAVGESTRRAHPGGQSYGARPALGWKGRRVGKAMDPPEAGRTKVEPRTELEGARVPAGKSCPPKWKTFKGWKLLRRDKIWLNNAIWRAWYLQYVKRRNPACSFTMPLETGDRQEHRGPEASPRSPPVPDRTAAPVGCCGMSHRGPLRGTRVRGPQAPSPPPPRQHCGRAAVPTGRSR